MSLLVAGLYFAPPIWAAPTPNLTALHNTIAPAWVKEPLDRGTWRILYSCTFTLVLCVYTAIHLNVPAHYDSTWKIRRRLAKWVAIAIFGPEVVVYVAFEQWYLARKFLKRLRKIADENTDEKFQRWYKDDPKKSPFDMVYAHYVLMGGFAANVEDMHNTYKIITFTTDGVLFLAKHGHFCRVSRGDIEDKSKADFLAKSLVCVQVLWVIGQTIERKAAGYPITLLEVHTIVHVVCALFMYALWFQKPLNVQRPTRIDLDMGGHLDLLAFGLQALIVPKYGVRRLVETSRELPVHLRNGFMYQPPTAETSSYYGPAVDQSSGTLPPEEQQPEFAWYRVRDEATIDNIYRIGGHGNGKDVPILTHINLMSPDDTGRLHCDFPIQVEASFTPAAGKEIVCTLLSGQSLECGFGPNFRRNRHSSLSDTPIAVSLSQKDVNRLQLASKFIRRADVTEGHREYDPVIYQTKCSTGCPPLAIQDWDFEQFVCHRVVNSEWYLLLRSITSDSLYLGVAMSIIPAAYGCIHLGALSIMFPTAAEKLIWRVSCFYLISAAAMTALIFAIFYGNRLVERIVISQVNHLRHNMPGTRYPIFPPLQELNELPSSGNLSQSLRCLFVKCWIRIAGESQGYIHSPIVALIESRLLKLALGPRSSVRWKIILYTLILFGLCVSLVYVAARIYLVIESFVALRHVPIGVYQSPSFDFFGDIPHI